MRSPRTATKSSPCSLQLEKARVQQRRPNAAKNKINKLENNNNKVLLYSTGNYIQYPVISHNGKEYEKEYIYICNRVTCGTAIINTTL